MKDTERWCSRDNDCDCSPSGNEVEGSTRMPKCADARRGLRTIAQRVKLRNRMRI